MQTASLTVIYKKIPDSGKKKYIHWLWTYDMWCVLFLPANLIELQTRGIDIADTYM